MLPTYSNERECDLSEIPAIEHEAFLKEVRQALDLGYTTGCFYTVKKILNSRCPDVYAYRALNADRKKSVTIGAISGKAGSGLTRIVSTTGSIRTADSDDLEFLDHRLYFDSAPPSKKIHVPNKGILAVDRAMQTFLAHSSAIPFADFAELNRHLNAVSDRACESRIARGLLIFEKEAEPS